MLNKPFIKFVQSQTQTIRKRQQKISFWHIHEKTFNLTHETHSYSKFKFYLNLIINKFSYVFERRCKYISLHEFNILNIFVMNYSKTKLYFDWPLHMGTVFKIHRTISSDGTCKWWNNGNDLVIISKVRHRLWFSQT